MLERWHPLGPVAVITAFNFPMAVWAWNAMLALVCGDSVVWKPSEKTPLSALALHRLLEQAIAASAHAPAGVSALVIGGRCAAEQLVNHTDIPLVSATGSTAMGRARARGRLFRPCTLLELGVTTPPCHAAELGPPRHRTAAVAPWQRCTTLRRLFMMYRECSQSLKRPLPSAPSQGNARGPLIDGGADKEAAAAARQAGPHHGKGCRRRSRR
jgi:aldehyde dehydrogenase (NAD+)